MSNGVMRFKVRFMLSSGFVYEHCFVVGGSAGGGDDWCEEKVLAVYIKELKDPGAFVELEDHGNVIALRKSLIEAMQVMDLDSH